VRLGETAELRSHQCEWIVSGKKGHVSLSRQTAGGTPPPQSAGRGWVAGKLQTRIAGVRARLVKRRHAQQRRHTLATHSAQSGALGEARNPSARGQSTEWAQAARLPTLPKAWKAPRWRPRRWPGAGRRGWRGSGWARQHATHRQVRKPARPHALAQLRGRLAPQTSTTRPLEQWARPWP